ncbi:D-hexose-6-phosphate mutarotase [Gordonia sp. Z-3]|uniref:Putative glucose-6-phosphate 1-epimerase n=2 Tax=Gordonia TaxID=2053 RepID=A0A9X3D843_9ACTN|nr:MULTISPECIES: D-hexose-6-phosphate mutarotase [Gordonia]MAU81976.1 D-hexose-6-phosphate mutarotase [Gordonia sp. (in: high G+C Gram-positive bacteria)]MCF3941233.1 D-hexose-6-phosphate mutarotase [Gordonia tangerina]MCX2966452.1 D-hexose-6-phosphate mutarotase [Gordonia aquimaris]MED5801782.1 D-hexose-6-phosphate mutarotase [Gordonia sp. Z-3]
MTTSDDIGGVRYDTFHGLDAVVVETPQAVAVISLFGGQVVSFLPADATADVIWLSPLLAAPPTPIRGGVPLCWPYFAREGQPDDAPSHGYARTARWDVIGGRANGSEGVELVLAPQEIPETLLQAQLTVRVGAALEHELRTHNPSSEPVTMTEAFHNYFRVADVGSVRVGGLDGLSYLDKFDGMRSHAQQGDWVLPGDDPRSDRVYPAAGGRYRLIDPGLGRVIEVTVRGGRSAVVWNPGEYGAAGMTDVGPHWHEFLCVEAANAGPDSIVVPAGGTHTLSQTISVSAR